MERLEFWPDYDGRLLFTPNGTPVDLERLALPAALIASARNWVAGHDDPKLPWEETRDDAWLEQGQRLFLDIEAELARQGIELVTGEPWWGSDSAAKPP